MSRAGGGGGIHCEVRACNDDRHEHDAEDDQRDVREVRLGVADDGVGLGDAVAEVLVELSDARAEQEGGVSVGSKEAPRVRTTRTWFPLIVFTATFHGAGAAGAHDAGAAALLLSWTPSATLLAAW